MGAVLLGYLLYYNVTHLHQGHGAQSHAEVVAGAPAAGHGETPAHATQTHETPAPDGEPIPGTHGESQAGRVVG